MGEPPRLSLLVLRAADVEASVAFFEAVGLRFQAERHGSGPRHFAAEWGGLVLEIYPEADQLPAECSTRLGFVVDDFDDANRRLLAAGAKQRSLDGSARIALYVDPDGRTVEIDGC